ncbi:MAG: hypothetical protein WA979_08165 [Pacificimonas sp.]
MANDHVSAAFTIRCSAADAGLLEACSDAIEALYDSPSGQDRLRDYAGLGENFAEAFPAKINDPFGSFLDLFPDPEMPEIGCAIERLGTGEDEMTEIFFSGDFVDPEAIGNLLSRAARSAHPVGFEYACSSTKLRPGAFGGGCVVVSDDQVGIFSTSERMSGALRDLASAA